MITVLLFNFNRTGNEQWCFKANTAEWMLIAQRVINFPGLVSVNDFVIDDNNWRFMLTFETKALSDQFLIELNNPEIVQAIQTMTNGTTQSYTVEVIEV